LFEQVRRAELSPDEPWSGYAICRLKISACQGGPPSALRAGMAKLSSREQTPAQVADIFFRLAKHGGNVLATRANEKQFAAVKKKVRAARYRKLARAITLQRDPKKYGKG